MDEMLCLMKKYKECYMDDHAPGVYQVGVYQFEGVSEKSEAMDLTAMDGKAIICEDLIISIPYSTLMENK
jgi:hypothetical protein